MPTPEGAKHLAWLDLDTQEGQEYWLAMNLAGDHASACHHDIHRRLAKVLGEQPIAMIENHHNFAWKENWRTTEVAVHRKGATPAGKGVLGIIPRLMVHPVLL
ncbi:MAG: RtcB family protein [Saprospiraceae bacterium]